MMDDLQEMIRSNQTLITLNFELDSTNEPGGTAIAEAMRINTTITDLNLGDAPGAVWPMDAAMRAEVDNTLRINKFLRGVDSDGAPGAPMAATRTQFPPANPAVAAAAAAVAMSPAAVATPAKEPVAAAPVTASPPAVPTPAAAQAPIEHPAAAAGTLPPLTLPSQQPQPAALSAAGVGAVAAAVDSPGSMLELLRQKLDAFQGSENGAGLAAAAAAQPAVAAAPAPAVQPTLAAVTSTGA